MPDDVPVAHLLERPGATLRKSGNFHHSGIRDPSNLYSDRQNSGGIEFGYRKDFEGLLKSVDNFRVNPKNDAGNLVESGGCLQVTSPVNGAHLAEVPAAAHSDVDTAFRSASDGFADWSAKSAEERASVLENFSELLEEKREDLIALLSVEAGKTLDDGLAEVREAVDFCRYYAKEARVQFGDDQRFEGPTGEENLMRHRGRGVFICISPWNFPLAIFIGQVTAALAAGNTVLAKPAEQTPLIASKAIELLHRAGAPEKSIQLMPGDGSVGAALVNHSKTAGVAFTGSTETAKIINRSLAAKDGPIVPLIAETGGINAMVVDATSNDWGNIYLVQKIALEDASGCQ